MKMPTPVCRALSENHLRSDRIFVFPDERDPVYASSDRSTVAATQQGTRRTHMLLNTEIRSSREYTLASRRRIG